MDEQVKSKQRVTEHGEVFTAEREVKAMCDLVAEECLRIGSRFLEPACGDGNFLAEILRRKLSVVGNTCKGDVLKFECDSLLAVSSLYGIDLLADNVLACRKRLFGIWHEQYQSIVGAGQPNSGLCHSVSYVLSKNIVAGNTLSMRFADGMGNDTPAPIVFSQWDFSSLPLVQREDYVFEDLLQKSDDAPKATQLSLFGNLGAETPASPPCSGTAKARPEQLSLFGGTVAKAKPKKNAQAAPIRTYPPMHYTRLEEYA